MKKNLKYFLKEEKYTNCSIAYGHFTTIHQGHLRYLKYAKSFGQLLLVAIIGNDEKYRFNQNERAEGLELIRITDGIILLKNNELNEVVEKLKPINLVLGKEFENSDDPIIKKSINFQISKKKKVYFHAGEVNYFNDNLLQNPERIIQNKRKEEFKNICIKQKLTKKSLINSLKKLKNARIAVIGDTIVDQYAACEPIGLSAEAPVVVVKELSIRNFIGGAAIVAKHIKSLGANCELISVIGNDENASLVKKDLIKNEIKDNLVIDASRPTTFKKRYIVENQKLFRVSRLISSLVDNKIENQLIKKLEFIAPNIDCLVVSDFVYGVITKNILLKIKELEKIYNFRICGDLQCSSQMGKITKFKGFTLLCPNEKEARIALEDNEIGLEQLSLKLIEMTQSDKLIMKLGANGFLSYMKNPVGNDMISQSFPALSANPVDVTGAGDSLLALISAGISTNQEFITISALACCISSLAVNNLGNLPISYDQLKEYLNELMN